MRTKLPRVAATAPEPRLLLTFEDVAERLLIKSDGRSVRSVLRRLGVPIIQIGKREGRVDAAALERALSESGN